jgi:hypothetical protein
MTNILSPQLSIMHGLNRREVVEELAFWTKVLKLPLASRISHADKNKATLAAAC